MRPACTPVTREPTVPTTEPAVGMTLARSASCTASGSSTTRNPLTLALIQPGRSTTATGPTAPWLVSPVRSRTGCCTTAVRPRSSATTARASVRLTCGPCLANLTPVEIAMSQSIICALLTLLPYLLYRPGGEPRPPGAPERGSDSRPWQGAPPPRRSRPRPAAAGRRPAPAEPG